MKETLMKDGSFRVDYLNRTSWGSNKATALYVRGCLVPGEKYSHSARIRLFEGLNLVEKNFGRHNLVAVYLDVCSGMHKHQPALDQMVEDLKKNIYCQICFHSDDPVEEFHNFWEKRLSFDHPEQTDLERFYRINISGMYPVPTLDRIGKDIF